MTPVLDRYLPRPDVQERFSIVVQAPAAIVYRAAINFDMQSPWIARAIFWTRDQLLGSQSRTRLKLGLVEETRELGWGCLEEIPNARYVAGASCEPWEANVVFHPLDAISFQSFSQPKKVKIAWTIETIEEAASVTILQTETRAVATDVEARQRFLRY